MNISTNGLAFIKREEGFIAVPQIDTDKMCWGYGHNRVGNEPVPHSITLADAEALLHTDLMPHIAAVAKSAPWTNQNQFDALVDFAYNAGDGALVQLLSHGRDNIAAQLPRWIHAVIKGQNVALPALIQRRARELALFNAPALKEAA